MPSEATTCDICVETYNLTIRKPIHCIKCDFICCKSCFKRYITDEESGRTLQCMSCQVLFDRTSLAKRLGQSFMQKEYKRIRENVLFEEEKQYFPATQQIIEMRLEELRLREEKEKLYDKYQKIKQERLVPLLEFIKSEETMRVCEAIDKYNTFKANYESTDEQLVQENNDILNKLEDIKSGNQKKIQRTYILACTTPDCKGMLSMENKNKYGHYVCAICTSTTCVECQMPINEDDHQCDPDVLKTVLYMSKTSKPCPQCSVPIHKISGCDQMFCTNCHVSFSWRTQKINNGAMHNPHHAEWLRNNQDRPREPLDVQCGLEPSNSLGDLLMRSMRTQIRSERLTKEIKNQAEGMSEYLMSMVCASAHHHHDTIHRLSAAGQAHVLNEKYRINLLSNEISEDDFKKFIQINDKRRCKRNELLQVAMTFRDALSDLIAPFNQSSISKTVNEWMDMVRQVKQLEEYCNECFRNIAETYGSRRYYIAGVESYIRS